MPYVGEKEIKWMDADIVDDLIFSIIIRIHSFMY